MNESLAAAARILDDAATEIRAIPLNPKNDNISHIANALTHIFDIQKQIYKIEPSLEPEFLRRPSPYPAELNRQFGEIVIRDADLCSLKEYKEAISIYESFIAQNPPVFFIKMAENRIDKIRRDYGLQHFSSPDRCSLPPHTDRRVSRFAPVAKA